METMKEVTVNINGMGSMVLFQAKRALKDEAQTGHDIVVTSGEDGVVYLTDLNTETVVSESVICDGAVPSCAVTPEQTQLLIVQEEENSLYSYSMPSSGGAQMDKLLFRSTVVIRQVVCSEKYIAIADEEAKVKVLLRSATDQVISIDGHEHGIKSVAIDPQEEFICSSSEDSTVRVFQLDAEKMKADEKAVFKVQYKDIKDDEVLCRCAWQRGDNSSLLAVPVNQGVIELFDRSSWKSTGQLLLPIGKSISSDINIVAFSPNGMYVAAATLAKQVFIWSVLTKEVVRSFKLDYAVLSVEWAISQNALVALHAGGKFGFVKDVIPMGRTPPQVFRIAAATAAAASNGAEKSQTTQPKEKRAKKMNVSSFIDGEDNASADADGEDEAEEDDNETRVEAIKASFGFGQAAANNAASQFDDDPAGKRDDEFAAYGHSKSGSLASSSTSIGVSAFRTITEPFQSGSVKDGAVCLLAWTPVGEIETIRGANLSENLVKVEFADKSRRGFKFSDNYMFSMASLDDHGAFFGVPRRAREEWEDDAAMGGDGNIINSFVFYRPFESWANNSSWHLDLPEGEDAECVAAAREFCAVATSLHCLRIYTTSGIAYALLRLPGRIVTMTAKDSRLAIVYQGVCGTLEFQLLHVRVDSSAQRVKLLASGALPLSPPPADVFASHKENELAREDIAQWSTLAWLGFDDRLILYAVDSLGCVQALSESVGWNWFPIGCVGNALNKKPADRTGVFTLGIVNESLLYFPLEKGVRAPKLRGKHRPVPLTFVLRNASFPKTTGSGGSKKTEQVANVMWQNVRLFGLEASLENGGCEDDGQLVQEQAEMDKALILMMKTACANDEPARVLDLAKCLHLEKSHQIAQKLAIHFGLRQLQNELYQLYYVKFEQPQQVQDEEVPVFRSQSQSQYQASAPTPPTQPQEPLRASLQSKALLSRRAAPAPQEQHESADAESECDSAQEIEESERAPSASSSSFFSKPEGSSSAAAAAPVARPVVERSVAPANPFLKKPAAAAAATDADTKKSGLSRLAKFTSPPPAKKRKGGWK